MSIQSKSHPKTIFSIQRQKQEGRKISSLTCYDYSTARLLDEAGIDFLLVGDSLAMTVLGHPNTLSLTMAEMLHHVKAVARGVQQTLLVADMPFLSYQVDPIEAVKNAGMLIQGGAHAVKLEGASSRILEVIRHMVEIGIPVMGHLGFTPQSIHTLGGFKVQGKTQDTAHQMIEGALQLQEAGAFAIVLEMVPVELASIITCQLDIPTIGIGAGNVCDGQILVIDDFLGRYSDLTPRFVRRYMEVSPLITDAVRHYIEDVQQQRFPNNDTEAFLMPSELLLELTMTESNLKTLNSVS